MGKSKPVPLKGQTDSNSELGEAVCDHLKIPQDRSYYFIDSRNVLSYISNRTLRFYVHVFLKRHR